MIIKTAKFIKSAAEEQGFIGDSLPQIAVAGKSNVGKSSFINFLCGNGSLARTSSTPGRTRLINYFLINETFYLTDLPGYGYAKVPKSELDKWARLMETYFAKEKDLKHLFLLVDSRHEIGENDKLMYNYIFKCGISFTVIATKTDKVLKSALQGNIKRIADSFLIGKDNVIPLSALKKTGKEAVLSRLEQILLN